MKSQGADFDQFGFSMHGRDIEDLYIQIDKVNASLYGVQTGETSLAQQIALNTAAIAALGTTYLVAANNLSDIPNAATARSNLGITSAVAPGCFNATGPTATLTNGITSTVVFTAETFGNSSYNTSTGSFTAPATGAYAIEFNIGFLLNSVPASSGVFAFVAVLFKNASVLLSTQNDPFINTAFITSQAYMCNGSVIANLTAGDTVSVQATYTSAISPASVTIGTSNFCGHRLT